MQQMNQIAIAINGSIFNRTDRESNYRTISPEHNLRSAYIQIDKWIAF